MRIEYDKGDAHGRFGAEVLDVDLARPLRESHRDALIGALAEAGVLVVRGQSLCLDDLKRVTRIFGDLLRVPYVAPCPEDPDVIAVLKEDDERDISPFGGDWHSDFSFLARPPGGSVLYAVDVPPIGGDTLWADQTAAYDSLPSALAERVIGRQAIHVGAPYGERYSPDPTLQLSRSIQMRRGDRKADEERPHPLVRTHPVTGQRSLFVNPIYTVRIEGYGDQEGRDLLQALYRHATHPSRIFRHRWTAGDVVMWDNRTTLHRAPNDYDGYRRLLYRTTFSGEAPY